jgi:hypothetical protein
MRTLLPWLPAFIFGGILILVGRYFQAVEKKKRLQRWMSTQLSALNIQAQSLPSNPLGAYRGKTARQEIDLKH